MEEIVKKRCINCKWYENFIGVCTCGDSEFRADYRDDDDVCEKWEGRYGEEKVCHKCINCNYYCERQLKGGFNVKVTIEPLAVQDDRAFYPFDMFATKADPEHFGFKSTVCLKHGIQLKPEAVGLDNICRFWKLKGGK